MVHEDDIGNFAVLQIALNVRLIHIIVRRATLIVVVLSSVYEYRLVYLSAFFLSVSFYLSAGKMETSADNRRWDD